MKQVLILLVLCVAQSIYAQRPIKQNYLEGNSFEMFIDIDQDALDAEIDDRDDWFGSLLGKSLTGLVSGVIDQIGVNMTFEPNYQVRIDVAAFGAHIVEYGRWELNDGYLYLSDDNAHGDNEGWELIGDRIVALDQDDHVAIYLKKIARDY